MASVKLLLNRDRALRDGSYPLVFQLIQNRRKRLIYTSFRLFPEEFDAVRGKVGAQEVPDIFSAYADTAYAVDSLGRRAGSATDEPATVAAAPEHRIPHRGP